jgi:type III pantothenate kinase
VDGLLRAQFRITSAIPRSADELFPLLERLAAPFLQGPDGAGRAVIGSVVPSLTEAYREVCRTLLGREPWIVSAGAVRGLRIEVPDPESVGADRVANAVAAAALHRVPAVVVDLGTATNFDVVLPGPRYVGGVIAPGVTSSAEELFRRGARLPKVEIVRPRRALGRTTTECIQSGVYFGAVEQIDGIVRRLRRELAIRPRVIATGGLAESIAEDSRAIQVVDPALTLHGLRILEQRMREG